MTTKKKRNKGPWAAWVERPPKQEGPYIEPAKREPQSKDRIIPHGSRMGIKV